MSVHVAQNAHPAQLHHWTAAAQAAAAAGVTQAPAIAKAAALQFIQHCHQTACSPAGNRETSVGVELFWTDAGLYTDEGCSDLEQVAAGETHMPCASVRMTP